MEYAYIVSLILFIINGALHLYGTWKCNAGIRKVTKVLILPFLISIYCAKAPVINLYVVAAFLLCWAGDLFLLKKGAEFLVMGGISFGLGHICFISAYLQNIDFRLVPIYTIAPLILVFSAIIRMSAASLSSYIPKLLKFPMMLYLLANAVMNAFAIMQLFSNPCNATITISLGALLFLYSDVVLFSVRFHKNDGTYKKHTIEMLSYMLGEFLICQGFLQM